VARQFERTQGGRVELVFGASGTLTLNTSTISPPFGSLDWPAPSISPPGFDDPCTIGNTAQDLQACRPAASPSGVATRCGRLRR
jgi:hypothetical protein